MLHHVLLGCGYLGLRVGRLWIARGDSVAVLTRSSQRAKQFGEEGFTPIVGDVTQPSSISGLFSRPERPHSVVYAIGYDRSQTKASIGEVYAGGLAAVLQKTPDEVEQVIYASTTGVYGDAAGSWVDETTPTNPDREGGAASLAAEEVLKSSRFATRGIILRLAGIYGPSRLPYIDSLQRGEVMDASPEGYLNLIHVDDAAELIVAMSTGAISSPGPHTYCISDGQPVWREEFYCELAARLGAPQPRFRNETRSPRQERGSSSKRISNRKIGEEIGFKPRYPSYREGLAQIVGELPDR